MGGGEQEWGLLGRGLKGPRMEWKRSEMDGTVHPIHPPSHATVQTENQKHVQLQLVTSPSSTGGLSLTLNLTFPQWHCPSYAWYLAFPMLGLVGVSALASSAMSVLLRLFLFGLVVSKVVLTVLEGRGSAVVETGVVTAATRMSAAVQGRRWTDSSKPQILQVEREGREGICMLDLVSDVFD